MWRIVGSETLEMHPDKREESDFHGIIPVTCVMNFEIDNIIINCKLVPLWKCIRGELQEKILQKRKQDWFEIQLVLFILLNHIDLTMSHDIDWAKLHALEVSFNQYSANQR